MIKIIAKESPIQNEEYFDNKQFGTPSAQKLKVIEFDPQKKYQMARQTETIILTMPAIHPNRNPLFELEGIHRLEIAKHLAIEQEQRIIGMIGRSFYSPMK